MKIRTDYIFVDHTLIAGFSGISRTVQHFSKRLVVIDIRAPSMILKADHRKIKQLTLNHNVVNETPFSLLRVKIYKMQSLNRSLFRFIIISKKLIAAADGNDNPVVLHILFKIFLDRFQFLTNQHLFPV